MRRSQGAQQSSVSQAGRSLRRDEKDATTRDQDAESMEDQEFMEPYSNQISALHATSEDARYNHQLQSLQNYVNELSDQNEILVQTVEELEKEANERVALLESRLQKTNVSLREQTKQCKDYEHELLHIRERNEDVLRAHEDYKNEASSLAEENVHLQNHIGNLEYDADLLIELINKARTTGKWELAQMDLRAVPYESLVSLHSPGPQSKQMPDGEKRLGEHITELKRQVKGRDDIIARLERDLTAKEELYKEVEEKVGMKEQAYYSVEGDVKSMETQQQAATSAITHKDILIMKLKSDVQLSREHQRDVAKQLQDCENTIAELQGEIGDFQGIVSMRVAETKNKEQSIQILEQLYKSSREKLSQSDRIIEQLKSEVQQVVKQSQDVTAYEDMIRRLETELGAADEQRKQTVKDFNNLKSSMSGSDMAVKEQIVVLTSKVEEKERENSDLRNEVRLCRRKNEAHTAEIEKCRMKIVELDNGFAAKSQQLMDSSEEVTLSDIPLQKLGYPSLELYIKSIPHCARISTNNQGVLVVKGVANEANRHVLQLVIGQKKVKKRSAMSRKPSRFGSSRGRGGFSRRAKPLTVIRKSNPFEFSNSSTPTRFGQSSRGFQVPRTNNSNIRPGIFGRPPNNPTSYNSFGEAAKSFQNFRGSSSGSSIQRHPNVGLPRTTGFTPRSNSTPTFQSQVQTKVLQEVQSITSGAGNDRTGSNLQQQNSRSTQNAVSSTYVLPPRMRRLQEQQNTKKDNTSSTQTVGSTQQSFGRKVEQTDLREVLENRRTQSSSSDINQNSRASTSNEVSKVDNMKFTIQNDQRRNSTTGAKEDALKQNVIQILEGKPNGLWSGVLLNFYKDKFGEAPANLLNLIETKMADRIEIQSMTPSRSIIYLKKEPEITQTVENENAAPAHDMNSAPIRDGNVRNGNISTQDTALVVNGRRTTYRKVTVVETNESREKEEQKVVVAEEEEESKIPDQVIPEASETFAAYCCHVDSIDRFFVNEAESPIIELSEKMQKFYENCDKDQSLLKPKIGMMCCALYKGQWFRARIIMSKKKEERGIYQAPGRRNQPIEQNLVSYQCKVLYVDFGNMETINSKDMRKLRQEFCELPAQAIQCKLHGITREGSQAEWSEEAVTCFQEITWDNLLDVNVVAARDNILDVDLMTTDDQSIAEELISRGHAISQERRRAVALPTLPKVEEPEQSPEPEGEEQREPEEILSPKSSILDRLTSLSLDIEEEIEVVDVEPPAGDFIDILVTAVNSLTEISAILLGKEYKGRLVVLGASMQAYFDSEETDDLETVELDSVYAAFYEDSWNRVRVTDIGEDEVEIYLVDRGDNGKVQRSELKKLPGPFRRLPLQAIELTLANLPDSENLEHIQVLSDMILGKELVAMLLERNPEETIVELFDTSTAEDLNINKQVIAKLGLNEDQDYSQTLPQAGEQTDAFVSHISDTGVFNVILPGAGFQRLDELIDELSNYYSKAAKAADLVKNPEHEKIVCTKWKEDGAIYRAKITCVMTEEKKAEIEFIDYGNRDVVSFVTLREIPEDSKELLTLPPQGVKCELADCPEGAKAMWKYDLASRLSAELRTQTVVIKIIKEATEDQLATVEILKADPINTSKFTSISEEIAEMCLSMRDNESSAVSTDSSLWNNEGDSIASHHDKPLPPTRSSSSSSGPFSEKPSSSEAAVPPFASQVSVASLASASFSAKTGLTVRDATIPDLHVKEKWCPVYVTCAQTPAKFYFLLHENVEMVTKLMDEMCEFYKDNDDCFEDCQPDDICAVFLKEHDTWYRGIVRSRGAIEDEDRVVLGIFLVDDGDTVFVSEEEVRQLPKQFHSMPFQAIKASLSDVLPIGSEKWPRKACKRYSEFVSQKLLYARIQAPSMSYPASYSLVAGDSLEVQLYDTTAEHIDILICDQLVHEGHAKAR